MKQNLPYAGLSRNTVYFLKPFIGSINRDNCAMKTLMKFRSIWNGLAGMRFAKTAASVMSRRLSNG